MKYHLKDGRIINPTTGIDEIKDIFVSDGTIERIGKSLTADNSYTIINLKGRIVTPGFIDMHCHLREPGYEQKETIET